MAKYKIGTTLVAHKDTKLIGFLEGDEIEVKAGEGGWVDSQGQLHYTTGAARGKIVNIKGAEMSGYAHDNMAQIIFNHLSANFGFALDEAFEEACIEKQDFIDEIQCVLEEIL